MRNLVRFFRCFPAALERAHLLWARAHLTKHNPLHHDLPEIVRRIAHLEDCRAR